MLYIDSKIYADLPGDLIDVSDADIELIKSRRPGDVIGVENGALLLVSDLSARKALKIGEIRGAARAAMTGGIISAVLGAAHTYPTDDDSQKNLNGLVTKSLLPGVSGPFKFWCADSQGVWERREHTVSQIQQLGLAVTAHVIVQQDRYELLLDQVAAAATLSGVAAIAW